MFPKQITVIGTGASLGYLPDIYQNPFQIGIGVALTNTGGISTAIVSIEHCFDYSTVIQPTWNGSTGVTWFPNSGISATTIATAINGNYAFGVAAIRVNVISAAATAVVVANFIQSVNSP